MTPIVLVFFAVDTLQNEPETFAAIVAIALLSIALDVLWKPAARATNTYHPHRVMPGDTPET